MKKDSRIYVAGHSGLVGSAIVRELERKGCENIVTSDENLAKYHYPNIFGNSLEYVFHCAAWAGGILKAIEDPVGMLEYNLLMTTNIIRSCNDFHVKKLLNLGSSCIYPVNGKQPYTEDQIGTGKTDENWSYAVAKIAGLELCKAYHKQYGSNFITAIPSNMYGPNFKVFSENDHVIPMLIHKFHEGISKKLPEVEIWGDGKARREFLYVDDFAQAAVMLMENFNYEDINGCINVGLGLDMPISDVVQAIIDITGYEGEVVFNRDRPNGVPSKLMDSSRIRKLGWQPSTPLKVGLQKTYEFYKNRSHNKSF